MKITAVGRTAGKIYSCAHHSHSDWEIVTVLSGSGQLTTDSDTLNFSRGTAYAIPPDTVHGCTSKDGFEDYYVRVDEIALPCDKITMLSPLENDFASLAEITYRIYCKASAGYSASFSSLVNAAATLFQDTAAEGGQHPLCANIRDYLNREFGNSSLNSELLSKTFGYNYDYLRRCFKKDYGVTPMQYLNRFRLRQAELRLISRQHYTVEMLASYCGFADKFYFSKCFKKQYGLSPDKFRKQRGALKDAAVEKTQK